MKKLFGLVTGLVLLAAACSKSDDNNNDDNNGGGDNVDCNTISKSFATNVSPLIAGSCAKSGCHDTGSLNGPGALTTYQQIFDARVQIRAAVSSGAMPKDATLSATQKATITCWIDAGAPND